MNVSGCPLRRLAIGPQTNPGRTTGHGTTRQAGAILVALGLGLGAGCSQPEAASEQEAERPRNVRVLEVQASDLTEYLMLSGRLRPLRGTDISTEEGGVVGKIRVEKGARVARGEVVIELDRDILRAEMASAEAHLTLRRINEENTRALYDEKSVSGQEMLLVHTQHEEAKAQAEIARTRYARAAIESPFDGIVTDRYVELGQLVSPGQAVFRIVDPFRLVLEGAATEMEIASIREEAPVDVAVDGVAGTVSGSVSWVGLEADPMTGKFPVEVQIENRNAALRPGVIGRARVQREQHDDALVIPRDAVVQRPTGPVVFVLEGDRARERRISLGADQGPLVVVRGGLSAGDQLVVRGQRDLAEGTLVAVQERATERDGSMPGDPSSLRPGDALDRFDEAREEPAAHDGSPAAGSRP